MIERLRSGDRAALEQLIIDHREMVARLVSRLSGWSGETDDLTQEVFVAALGGIRRFQGGSRLSTWLTRIAINVCRHHHRTRMLRIAFWRRLKEDTTEINESDASQPAEARERVSRISQAVRRLKPKYREVVVLHYLEGMEVGQVAQMLDLSRSAVEVRLHRGRQMLKEMLKTE